MKPNWMSRELPMSWMSCICRKNAAPCSSLNAYPFPAFWEKPRGFSEAKKPSFQLKNFGMSKKKSSFRRCNFLNCRVDMSWTTGKARWAIPAPSPVVSKRPKRRTNSKGWASETAHPIPPFFGAGERVDGGFAPFFIEPISSREPFEAPGAAPCAHFAAAKWRFLVRYTTCFGGQWIEAGGWWVVLIPLVENGGYNWIQPVFWWSSGKLLLNMTFWDRFWIDELIDALYNMKFREKIL